jgi:dephospho-CoA kinase
MILIGLTGSIAMGKSTVAAMFAAAGAPVFDSDAAVHAFYRSPEAQIVEAEFPSVSRDGAIDRNRLADLVVGDSSALARLEGIVHPVVEMARKAFVQKALAERARQVVIDIPLLLEIGADRSVDLVIVVSAPASVQKARALARPGMTRQRFESILARQASDREKRRRAHFIIDTGGSMEATMAQMRDILRCSAAMTGRSV